METQKKLGESIEGLEYDNPLIEKDTIKITKNSRGFNYEFKVVSKKNVDAFDQIDHIHDEIMKRINKWSTTEVVVKSKTGDTNGESKKY